VSKVDLKREEWYRAPRDGFAEVDVPAMQYLQLDGSGSPDAPAYAEAVAALYALSYPVKFASKSAGRDYVVCPLEGLWWSERYASFAERAKDEWSWTMMIRQPDWITAELVEGVRERAAAKAPAAAHVRLAALTEGLSVQTMHHGSFDDETPVLARLHEEYLPAHGLIETGYHHEIYFTDPRTTEPQKLRTLIRQPVARR
jgi:hypothetical protein